MPDLDDLLAELTALNASVAALVENTAFKRAQLDAKVDEAAAVILAATAAMLPQPFCTYGGSANAFTLTSPFGLLAPVLGMKVRFRATASNTGATTLNLDGSGAVACRTVRGVALPFGYIRTGVDTEAVFDGTYWVVGREVEEGSNANGYYVRHADGRQELSQRANSSAGGFSTWDYPFGFTSPLRIVHTATVDASGYARFASTTTAGSSTFAYYSAWDTTGARVAALVNLRATGYWY